ncbi:MAG TPA: outer membrane beta-barrel protein [Candidatus Acidoferrum sp.]|nr:outer membrane beta-barrel protein [Candidatus Acidoferrum sp.]
MKRICVCALLLLGSVSVAQAQVEAPKPLFDTDNAAPDFSATSAAKATLPDLLAVTNSLALAGVRSTPPLKTVLLAEPASAGPATPSPKPRFVYGGRDDYRWQLGLSLALVHFNSSAFSANAIGVKTSVAYFLNEWLGVEGSVTGAFSPTTIGANNVKVVIYGAGPKVAWRQQRWEPWLHAIFGGAHEQPQTADQSRNSYSIEAGGGADYRWNPHLSFRAEGNYVRTGFFGQSQNNFELAGGAILHF